MLRSDCCSALETVNCQMPAMLSPVHVTGRISLNTFQMILEQLASCLFLTWLNPRVARLFELVSHRINKMQGVLHMISMTSLLPTLVSQR